MKAKLIHIGKVPAVRVPRRLIEQCRLGDVVDLRVEKKQLIRSSRRRPRQGWEKAFRIANASKDQLLIDDSHPTEFEWKEWRW